MPRLIQILLVALALSAFLLHPAEAVCPAGDLNGDCEVNLPDLQLFSGQWLDGECSGHACADLNGEYGVEMADFAQLAGNWLRDGNPLVINEFMASNAQTLESMYLLGGQWYQEYPDWIEICNTSAVTVDIGGLYLTDDLNEPTMWQFPAGTTIDPYGYIVVFASGKGPGLIDFFGRHHTSFRLSAEGEQIGLFEADGDTPIDNVIFGQQTGDISYGRYPDGGVTWRYFGFPSPEEENDGGFLGEIADTECSHKRGFYDAPFSVIITCDTPGVTIYYSLDGTEPGNTGGRFPTGTKYTGPIAISGTTCLRARAIRTGWRSSDVETHTYLFNVDPTVRSLPIVSLVGGAGETFYEPDGIMAIVGGYYGSSGWVPDSPDSYNNAIMRGIAYERPISFEWMVPDDDTSLQVNCGIRVHGSPWIRPRYRRCDGYWTGDCKFSFRLYFRASYGPSRLEYPLLPYEVERFKSLSLRAGHNDRVNPFIKDELIRRLHADMGHVASLGVDVNLLINGEYKGYFNLCEHIKSEFCQQWYESENEFDVMSMDGIRDGDTIAWNEMVDYFLSRDLSKLSNYEQAGRLLDLVNFVDYLILQLWNGNWDWPQNNWSAARERSPEGMWRFFIWDAEGAMFGDRLQTVYFDRLNTQGNANGWLYRALKSSAEFRQLFADRIYKHFYNHGALTEANIQKRFYELRDEMIGVIPNMDMYVLNTWVPERLPIFLNACTTEGVWTFNGPTFYVNGNYKYGGYVDAGDGLTMTNPKGSGTIYYTLDGTDPRLPGGAVNTSHTFVYSSAITLTDTTQVKARVLYGSTWSALAEAIFAIGPVAENLRITEIMYHPQDTNDPYDPNEEFIELVNIGPEGINLNLVSFTEGINYTFTNIDLAAGERIVVVAHRTAFEAQYDTRGMNMAPGEYTGRLANNGERIKLEDAIGQTILDFEYKDRWYDHTDGEGFSLTVIDATSDPNSWGKKDSWRASACAGGSPGEDDSGLLPNPGAIVINEVMAHSHLGSDWIELYNTTGVTIYIGGWYLSDDDANLMKYRIADGTTIGTDEYKVFYENLHFGNWRTDPGCLIPFALSENGEVVCLSSGEAGVLTGYREKEDFGASETGVSLGRYYKSSTNNFNFVALDSNTPGSGNTDPQVGPIVINEIMYNPDWPEGGLYNNDDYEYVELYNISGSSVTLYDDVEHAPWKFTDGIDFTFPADSNDSNAVTIAPGGYLVIVKKPAAFFWRYPGVPPDKVLGPYDGQLSNGGERVELGKPGDVDDEGNRYYIRVDRVDYSDGSHPEDCPGDVDLWPKQADGLGKSLTRKVPSDYGNDVANWQGADPSPGY